MALDHTWALRGLDTQLLSFEIDVCVRVLSSQRRVNKREENNLVSSNNPSLQAPGHDRINTFLGECVRFRCTSFILDTGDAWKVHGMPLELTLALSHLFFTDNMSE